VAPGSGRLTLLGFGSSKDYGGKVTFDWQPRKSLSAFAEGSVYKDFAQVKAMEWKVQGGLRWSF
jgi:hypothetical protein